MIVSTFNSFVNMIHRFRSPKQQEVSDKFSYEPNPWVNNVLI